MIRFVQLAAALLLLAACGSATTSYFPLTKGWQWSYEITVTTMDGTQHKRLMIENLGSSNRDGQSLQVRGSANGTRTYYREGDAGVVRIGETPAEQETVFYEAPVVVLPAKLEVGSAWSATEYTVALEHTGPPEHSLNRITVPVDLHYRIEAIGDKVSVPAG
ncbi:MAG: hypothetical protein U1F34_09950, partial [Gammaproteobacteria bacterium]